MDLSRAQQKLEALQNKAKKTEKKEKVDYTKIYWKPEVGKAVIRIVPSAYDKENPFSELLFHYGIGGIKSMLSPTCYGEKDPIIEFAAKLRQNYSPENYKLAKKLDPKMRIFCPVIVRGEEEKGVRLWQFGKQIYEQLLSLAADEEVGDFTDIMNGLDFNVETVGTDVTGTDYNRTTIRPKMKQSPLSTDKALVEKWLSEQPEPVEQFKKYSYADMKEALTKWLTPEEETEEDESTFVTDTDDEGATIPKQAPKYQAPSTDVKQSKEKKFDALFEEDDEETSESLPLEDEDDLPIGKPTRKK